MIIPMTKWKLVNAKGFQPYFIHDNDDDNGDNDDDYDEIDDDCDRNYDDSDDNDDANDNDEDNNEKKEEVGHMLAAEELQPCCSWQRPLHQ